MANLLSQSINKHHSTSSFGKQTCILKTSTQSSHHESFRNDHQFGPGETPHYYTFALSGRNPYGLPPGVGPREPHYNPLPYISNADYRGLSTRHSFADHDIVRMQFQLGEVAFNHNYYRNRDPYMEYDGLSQEITPYNTDANELISQFGEQFRYR